MKPWRILKYDWYRNFHEADSVPWLLDGAANYRKLPDSNIISGDDLEEAELRLKQEVLQKAGRDGLRLYREASAGTLTGELVSVLPGDVETPRELFTRLSSQHGLWVDYHRIPVSDERAPEDQDIDELLSVLTALPPDAPRIFNCHAGRGRTTTGMVIAELVERAMNGDLAAAVTLVDDESFRQQAEEDQGALGSARVLLDLTQVMEASPRLLGDVDRAIDRCSHLQNLRQAIASPLTPAPPGCETGPFEALRVRSEQYLERYFQIVTFARYLHETPPQDGGLKFSEWKGTRPDLRESLEALKTALGLYPRTEYTIGH